MHGEGEGREWVGGGGDGGESRGTGASECLGHGYRGLLVVEERWREEMEGTVMARQVVRT